MLQRIMLCVGFFMNEDKGKYIQYTIQQFWWECDMLIVFFLSFLALSGYACFVLSQMFKSEFWMPRLILVGGVQISYESMNRL